MTPIGGLSGFGDESELSPFVTADPIPDCILRRDEQGFMRAGGLQILNGEFQVGQTVLTFPTEDPPDPNTFLKHSADGSLEWAPPAALAGSVEWGQIINTPTSIAGYGIFPGSIDHGAIAGLADDDHTQYYRADGTRTMTGNANWGGFNLSALGILTVTSISLSGVLTSTIVTGTPPFTVASTTLVANLNADLLDSQHGAYYRDADNLLMAVVGSPTFTTVQHMQDIFHSSGWGSLGGFTENGNDIDVAAGTGLIRATDSGMEVLNFFDWSASAGNTIPLDAARYIGVEYNAGSPRVVVKTTDTWDYTTDFPLGAAVRDSGGLHSQFAPHAVGDHASFMIQRAYEVNKFARDNNAGGLILGEDGVNRYVTVSAGAVWSKLRRFPLSDVDTDPLGGADTFQTYNHVAGVWTLTTGVTQWPNTAYDDGTSLVTMTNNRYANLWFYMEPDGEVVMLYGAAQYTSSAGAEAESPPSNIPLRLQVHSFLIGRSIFKKSASAATQIETAFGTTFAMTLATDHGNLAGLMDDDHTDYHTDARALTWLGTRSTTDLPEGTNLYYTDGRADARIAAADLEKLSDVVAYSALADDEILQYNTAAGGWRHRTLAEAGISAGGHTHVKVDITDTPWAWGDVSKSGSSLADLATRSAGDLSSGILVSVRLSGVYSGITGLGVQAQALDMGTRNITNVGTFTATGTTTLNTVTYTWPALDGGGGTVLSTSGAGVLSWAAAGIGTITEVVAGAGLTGGGSSGSVTLDVVGTAARITVAANSIDIASTYLGQTSITTLGTITTGTWNGATIATANTAAKVVSVLGGVGIDSTGGANPSISLNVNELAVGGVLLATDHLVAANATVSNRQLISAIPLGIFNNDQGWTSNSGDITGVNITAGTGLSGSVNTSSGQHTQTLSVNASQTQITAVGTLTTGTWQAGVISTTYTSAKVVSVLGGVGIDSTGGANPNLTLDVSELAVGGTLVATDHLVAANAAVSNRQLISSIPLSIFNNNSGWTSNTGDITGVNITAGTGLSGSVNTSSGQHTQTLSVNASQTQITSVGALGTGSINWSGAVNIGIALFSGGTCRLSPGTVSLPSFSFTADTGTGMYRSGASQLSLVTGGIEGLKITSTREIVLGGGSGSKLNITGGSEPLRFIRGSGTIRITQTLNVDQITFYNSAGTIRLIRLGATGVQIGAPTGGDKGAGTLNVAGDIYKNNSAYTNPDYVFELAHDNSARKIPYGYRIRNLEEIEAYTRTWYHLPGTHYDRPMGMFDRGDWLLEKVEETFLHLIAHHHQLSDFERRFKNHDSRIVRLENENKELRELVTNLSN